MAQASPREAGNGLRERREEKASRQQEEGFGGDRWKETVGVPVPVSLAFVPAAVVVVPPSFDAGGGCVDLTVAYLASICL